MKLKRYSEIDYNSTTSCNIQIFDGCCRHAALLRYARYINEIIVCIMHSVENHRETKWIYREIINQSTFVVQSLFIENKISQQQKYFCKQFYYMYLYIYYTKHLYTFQISRTQENLLLYFTTFTVMNDKRSTSRS